MIDRPLASGQLRSVDKVHEISNGQLQITVVTPIAVELHELIEQIVMLLPLLMWVAAALLSWLLVRRLLLHAACQAEDAPSCEYQPGEQGLELADEVWCGVRNPGRVAWRSNVPSIGSKEPSARRCEALEGQRRLVREVHHRVKNNLQVVASLLSIHGRSADQPEAKAAYSAIGRRVDALSVVHRHHYAELEENRGIALRPLLTELTADLRSSAPVEAREMRIELELDAP